MFFTKSNIELNLLSISTDIYDIYHAMEWHTLIQGGRCMINFNVNPNQQAQVHSSTQSALHKSPTSSSKKAEQDTSPAVSYDASKTPSPQKQTYTVDMEKVRAMKEETDQRMLELFRHTARETTKKQLAGARKDASVMTLKLTDSLSIDYTAEDAMQAQKDIAPGGYWSPEETSNRLVDFAKALSGGNPEKAAMLKDAFEKGFKEIEEMFGGTLPDISYETYDLTMDKFDQWASEAKEAQ